MLNNTSKYNKIVLPKTVWFKKFGMGAIYRMV